jgi:hypothetical protein
MSAYAQFFFSSFSAVVELDTIELSHPNLSQVYRFVRNNANGITATLETGAAVDFAYYPLTITRQGSNTDLDQKLQINLGDLGEMLPTELDAIAAANNFVTKPVVIFRSYRSDNLTAPLYGPIQFNADNIAFNQTGATISANAPQLNTAETGELYTVDRFPMLNGLL